MYIQSITTMHDKNKIRLFHVIWMTKLQPLQVPNWIINYFVIIPDWLPNGTSFLHILCIYIIQIETVLQRQYAPTSQSPIASKYKSVLLYVHSEKLFYLFFQFKKRRTLIRNANRSTPVSGLVINSFWIWYYITIIICK